MRLLQFGLVSVLALLVVACSHAPKQVVVQRAPLPESPGTPELQEAMSKLSALHGVWVGPAVASPGMGETYELTQTERVGPLLGGDVLLIEGRGFEEDEQTVFNAFAVVSYDPRAGKYEMRSYARGYASTFDLELTEDGFIWETPAGRNAVMRYTATVVDGTWREVGEYIAEGREPVKAFEMNLVRVGDTEWPLGEPIRPDVEPPPEAPEVDEP